MFTFTTRPGYVPSSYSGPGAPEWANQAGGPSSLPIIGWTCQNSTGPAFLPYDTTHIGRIPDWEANGIPATGGQYDMNQTVGSMAPNVLNQGPIGDSLFDGWEGQPPNPNAPNTDVSGTIDLEW